MWASTKMRAICVTMRRGLAAGVALGWLAACTSVPTEVPPRFAPLAEQARREPWPNLCAVPPRPSPAELAPRTEAAEATRAAGRRASLEAATLRRELGLPVVRSPVSPPAPPRPRTTRTGRGPLLVEVGSGRTVRAETATGDLADLLGWIEEALRAPGATR